MTPISLVMRSLVLMSATAAVAGVPAMNGVMGHGPVAPLAEPEQVPSYSARYQLEFVPAPSIILGAVDEVGLMLEDDNTPQPTPLRFGIQREVAMTLDDGQWITVPGGRVWRCTVEGVGSLNARLHLSGVELGQGQELFLDSPDGTGTVGPITDRGSFDNGEAWGIFTPGAASRIEWFVPEGTEVTGLPFETVEYSQGYRDIFDVMKQSFAAQCHNDTVCYPTWANQSNAAARMTFTSAGSSYLCSGQMMATTAADETPYFSTANHCISTQSEAASLVLQFFYRASTCNGSNNAGTSVSGADLVSTYFTSDCTLLMVRGALPASVYWAGWMSTNPANGTASVGIHYPAGAEQDISFCTKTAANNFCGSGSNWSQVAWTVGITEGGSSGSALYQESTQQLYGVLTCGASSCTNTTGADGYGRWDVALSTGGFGAYLAAGADDAQEPNDSCAAPKVLTAATYSNLVVKRLNSDWYAVDVAAGATLTATATYTHSYGDIDFRLWDACGATTPLVNANGNVNNETITWTNSGSASARVYLETYLASNTRNTYSLTVALSGGSGGGGGGGGGGGSGTGSVKISQAYGGGGSTSGGPTYNKDYVEIFNSSDAAVNIGGWTIEYGSATGTWGSSATNIFTFPAGTTIQPCQYLLVAGATGSAAGGALPLTPDFTFTIAMSATNGKVALFNAVNSNKACGSETAGTLVDKLAYGTGNCPEGTAVATLTVITGAVRNNNGRDDTDNNSADFTIVTAPVPHNAASPAPAGCGGTPCPEDLDGDGQVTSGDIAFMLLDFGPCSGCTSDLDGSGDVSNGDVALLLLSYGPCP